MNSIILQTDSQSDVGPCRLLAGLVDRFQRASLAQKHDASDSGLLFEPQCAVQLLNKEASTVVVELNRGSRAEENLQSYKHEEFFFFPSTVFHMAPSFSESLSECLHGTSARARMLSVYSILFYSLPYST